MKRCALVILLVLHVLPAVAQEEETPLNVYFGKIPQGENTYFVAPDGDNIAPGTEEEPWATLDYAVTQVDLGDVIVMRGGVYEHDETIRIETPSGYTDQMIVVVAYPGEVPILDFEPQPDERNNHGIRLNANWWHLIGITIRNASHNGIRIDGSYNVLEQVTAYGNEDTGIHMAGGASYNLIKNCDSFHNFNSTGDDIGGNADGFGAKFEIGPANRFFGCRAWENSDDGFDFWEAENTIVIENSWAFGNGDGSVFGDPAGFDGNGNGFKLGGGSPAPEVGHIVTRSLAFNNFGTGGNAKGFDYNNNRGAMRLTHNTAYNNGRNFYFPLEPSDNQAVFVNNLSVASDVLAETPDHAVVAGNSWQEPAEMSDDVFLSVDTEPAKSPRESDGSLPETDFLKPAPGSVPVDAGVLTGERFYGPAPDMGAIELEAGEPVEPWVARGSGLVVSELKVFDLEYAPGWEVRDDLAVGVEAFAGDDAVVTNLPPAIVVEDWIRTAAGTRTKNYLFRTAEFTAASDTYVLVAHAETITEKPEWLADYVETSVAITITDSEGGEHRMLVYQRMVAAGEVVTLGRNSIVGDSSHPMYLVMAGSPVNVSTENPDAPALRTAIREIYPNPVSESATITFSLGRASEVSIRIVDALGREVDEVAAGFYQEGDHTVRWEAGSVPAGVYYCRVKAGGVTGVRTIVRVR